MEFIRDLSNNCISCEAQSYYRVNIKDRIMKGTVYTFYICKGCYKHPIENDSQLYRPENVIFFKKRKLDTIKEESGIDNQWELTVTYCKEI